MSTIRSFADPVAGTIVVFDDDVAVEIPADLDLGKVLDGAGWLARTGRAPSWLGIEVTVFAGGIHPRFVAAPTVAENQWAWLQTIGASGGAGLDTDEVLAVLVAAIDANASAKQA